MRPLPKNEAWLVLAAVFALLASAAVKAQENRQPPTLAETQRVGGLIYSPDGSFLLGPCDSGPLGVFDAKTGRFRVQLEPPNAQGGGGGQIDISPEGKKVAGIDGAGRRLYIWDTASGKLVEQQTLPECKDAIASVPFLKFSADGAFLYAIWDPIVRDRRILEAKLGGKNRLLAPDLDGWSATFNTWAPQQVAFDPTARLLIVAKNNDGPGAKLGFFPCAGGKPRVVPLDNTVGCIALTRDGKTLALALGAAGEKSKLELWDVATLKRRSTAVVHPRNNPRCYRVMAFSPDGKTLAGAPGRTDDSLDVIDLDGTIRQEIPGPKWIPTLQFSPDGKTLLVAGQVFVDPASGEEKPPPGAAPPRRARKKPREQSEAEKLFRAMEKKILEAKTFKIDVTLHVKALKGKEDQSGLDGRTATYKGSLLLVKEGGNKARLKVTGNWFDVGFRKKATVSVVCDGRFVTVGGDEERTRPAPKDFPDVLTRLLIHEGVATFTILLGYGSGPPSFEPMWLHVDGTDFRAGAPEKVRGRMARPVTYRFGLLQGDEEGSQDVSRTSEVTIWIDTKTLLPLKHVIALEGHRFTETYTEFTLDPKIEPKAP
jgi:hypothetical protein